MAPSIEPARPDESEKAPGGESPDRWLGLGQRDSWTRAEEQSTSPVPQFGSAEWTQHRRAQEALARAHELKDRILDEILQVPGLSEASGQVRDRLMGIYFEEIGAVERGEEIDCEDAGERQIRATFRPQITSMSSSERQQVWLQMEPLFSSLGNEKEFTFKIEPGGGQDPHPKAETTVRSYRCASCGESIEMQEHSVVCRACGTRNRLPDNEPEAFDAKVDRLGRGGDGFLGWANAALNVGGTTATWGNLERIEVLPLEESRYWQMSDHDRVVEGRKWAKLASLDLPRPNKVDRCELVKLFGGTSRAKSFFTWTRMITPEGFNESLRWVRCDHCGHDLVFSALCVGLLACEQCGKGIDVTVYGDETFGKHMTMSSRINYNRLPRITGRKLIPVMPDVEIVRPSAHRGR